MSRLGRQTLKLSFLSNMPCVSLTAMKLMNNFLPSAS
uniref:Uncharacterized protein n=1 Tax=Rhizophora mucronata TaxID=61149 RepID=A0A2P2NEL6_RHIMU